jgi:hypothetical protein
MLVPNPQDIALIRLQPGEGLALKGVHDFLLLLGAHCVVRVP